jgi:hypothetical protein
VEIFAPLSLTTIENVRRVDAIEVHAGETVIREASTAIGSTSS